MGGKSKMFTAQARDNVASILAGLKEKPDKGLLARDIIASLKAEIMAAQKIGYTIDEILQSFKQGGVDIGLSTLKTAMMKSTKKRTSTATQSVAPKSKSGNTEKRSVTPEERKALRQETQSSLTPAATKRGER